MNTLKEYAYRHLKGDPVIWFIVILLSLFGIVVVYSATGSLAYKMMSGNTEYYLIKHSALVLMSLLAMYIVHRVDYRYYSRISRLMLWISVPLLLFTWKFGLNLNESTRWINIPFINQAFQPSDLASLSLLITLAAMLCKRQANIQDFQKAIIPMLVWIGLICGLIALTNVSSAVLLFLTCLLMLFIGRVPIKYLLLLLLIITVFGSGSMMLGQRWETAKSRVESFVNGEMEFQSKQAYIAIAEGGLVGKGPGQSDQRNYLPSAFSDFIYAIILEEYGFIGGVMVILLYLGLLYRGMVTTYHSERAYGGLLAAGLSFAIVLQAFVNMAVAVGLGPITGLPLPLISMGGTSQLFMGISLGIILSVSRGETENNSTSFENNFREEMSEAA